MLRWQEEEKEGGHEFQVLQEEMLPQREEEGMLLQEKEEKMLPLATVAGNN